MGTNYLQVNFRMPEDLKSALEKEAKASGRSLTAEIIHRLQSSLTGAQEASSMATTSIAITDDLAAAIEKSAAKMGRTVEGQALYTLQSAYMPLASKD